MGKRGVISLLFGLQVSSLETTTCNSLIFFSLSNKGSFIYDIRLSM